jgi:TorA maturation chaperone TorD
MAEATSRLQPNSQAATALLALKEAWEKSAHGDALATEYTRLFARNVLCPPYESSYGPQGAFTRVLDLSELAGFYAAFGFKLAEDHKDLQDHLSLELEFLSVLCGKEAIALEEGWSARARLCHEARRKFLDEHLTWLPFLAEKLLQHASLPFYPAAIAWVEALLAADPDYAQRTPVTSPA